MSNLDTSVKAIISTFSGAPGINYSAGSLVAALDSLLVNGFGSVTLTSLTVTNEVATATVSAGHGFSMMGNTGPVIVISGSDRSSLNGEWRIGTIASSTVFTFACTGESDGTITGEITAKIAPLGWDIAYSETNQRVYRMKNGVGTGCSFHFDDSGLYEAKFRGYETVTDLSGGVVTGTNPFPTAAQLANGFYIAKANATSPSTNRKWVLVGDNKAFYLAIVHSLSYINYFPMQVGDFYSYYPSDGFCSTCLGSDGTYYSSTSSKFSIGSSSATAYVPRAWNQLTASQPISPRQLVPAGASATFSGAYSYSYPNLGTTLHLDKMFILDQLSIRGHYRGFLCSMQGLTSAGLVDNGGLAYIESPVGLHGRTVLAVPRYLYGSGMAGILFFDITGPWE